MRYIYLLLLTFSLYSCKETEKQKITRLVNEWEGKEIVFPKNIVFTVFGKDTTDYVIPDAKYKIVTYVDSIGCTSCKLQLAGWKDFIHYTDSITNKTVPFLFFFQPKDKKEICYFLKRDNFDMPVCIDQQDELNRLNKFTHETAFHTFLLDKNNHVKAIGNPAYNPKVKELYMQIIITGEKSSLPNSGLTYAEVDKTEFDLGQVSQKEVKEATFTLRNTGNVPLMLYDVNTSCGCTSVSYAKKPVREGENVKIEVRIKPKTKGHFYETITVHCNVKSLPIQFYIKGDAL